MYPKKNALAFRTIGLLFFLVFVGLIHTLFWVQFLNTVQAGTLFGTIFVVLTSVSGFLHLVVWRRSRQMVFTFIPHLLLNLVPLIWTGYSMVPYLFSAAGG